MNHVIRRVVSGHIETLSHLCLHILRLTEQELYTREYSIYTECLLSKLSCSGLLLPWPTNGNGIIEGGFVSYKNIQFILQKNIKCCSPDPTAWAALKGCYCLGPSCFFIDLSSRPWTAGILISPPPLRKCGEKWKWLMSSRLSKFCKGS